MPSILNQMRAIRATRPNGGKIKSIARRFGVSLMNTCGGRHSDVVQAFTVASSHKTHVRHVTTSQIVELGVCSVRTSRTDSDRLGS